MCALLWSTEYRELISSHGFARNEVTIWKYPTMTKVAELLGHTERVLYMAMSPDGSVVVSCSIPNVGQTYLCVDRGADCICKNICSFQSLGLSNSALGMQ